MTKSLTLPNDVRNISGNVASLNTCVHDALYCGYNLFKNRKVTVQAIAIFPINFIVTEQC